MISKIIWAALGIAAALAIYVIFGLTGLLGYGIGVFYGFLSYIIIEDSQ